MTMRKRRKTVRLRAGEKHSIVVYTDHEAWDDFERLRKFERIGTRPEAFRLLMKRAIQEKKIK